MNIGISIKEPPEMAVSGGSFVYGGGELLLRLIAVVIPVEPFADAVGSYTSHNGNNKTYEH